MARGMIDFAKYYRDSIKLFKQGEERHYGNVRFSNWWTSNSEDKWFIDLVNACGIDKNVRFYSVFGSPKLVLDRKEINIFFSGENLEPFQYSSKYSNPFSVRLMNRRIKAYGDYQCNRANVSIGFGYQSSHNYYRLPLWIIQLFGPNDNLEEINRKIETIEKKHNPFNSVGEIALFASHDEFGMRSEILNGISSIAHVVCPGKFNHNTNEKWIENKINFLHDYKFNICAENVDAEGYVSEKIIDSFKSGAIPIYIGSKGAPEPQIINPDSYIYWNYDGCTDNALIKVNELLKNEESYNDFCKINKFVPDAAQKIYGIIQGLKTKIKDVAVALEEG